MLETLCPFFFVYMESSRNWIIFIKSTLLCSMLLTVNHPSFPSIIMDSASDSSVPDYF